MAKNMDFDLHWFGMLTTKNVESVVGLLRELLTGKRYTFVAANEYFGFKPEVQTGQRLENGANGDPFSIHRAEDGNRVGFNVCDTYGAWGCSTNLVENNYDHEFKNPYFHFEGSRVTITHRAPSGSLLFWVMAVEREEV